MKLIINEPPVLVLPSLAKIIGLNEAIFLQQLHYWVISSSHVFDGRRWVYNTIAGWNAQFPFWSVKTIRRTIGNLKERGIIDTSSRHNKKAYDKTLWFSINYQAITSLEIQFDEKVCGQNDHSVLKASGQNDHIDVVKMTTPIPETTREESIPPLFAAVPSASLPESPREPKPRSTARRNPAANKQTLSEHAWLSRWWCWAFAYLTGGPYAFDKKAAGIIQKLLADVGFDQAIERAVVYLLLPERQRFPKGAPTLEGLRIMINQLAGKFDDEIEAKAIRAGIFPGDGVPYLAYWKPWEAAA